MPINLYLYKLIIQLPTLVCQITSRLSHCRLREKYEILTMKLDQLNS